MKKCIILVLLACSVLVLSGCDKRSDKDVDVSQYRLFLNVTEHYDINTYNGYKCVLINQDKSESGAYTLTMVFDRIGLEAAHE